jgi:Methyltransferase domain
VLTHPKEIEIISRAAQVNVRDPSRSRTHFDNIFADFLHRMEFTERHYLDIGAGQFDFAEMVRQRGGTCTGLDNDPAVLELGRYKGFETVSLDIQDLKNFNPVAPFDGVFNKFSFNAFWFPDEAGHADFVAKLDSLLKPNGWAWLAPWNGLTPDLHVSHESAKHILETQSRLFRDFGFTELELSEAQTKRYGVHGRVENSVIFTKNIGSVPPEETTWSSRLKARLGLAT